MLESADEVFFERIFESEMRSVVVPGFGEVRCVGDSKCGAWVKSCETRGDEVVVLC